MLEFTYLSLFSVYTILSLFIIFLLIQIQVTKSIVSQIFLGFLLLMLYTACLLYSGAELFGTLLILTEMIVFFYILCTYFSKPTFKSPAVYWGWLPVLLLCYPMYNTYIDFFFKNWYLVIEYISNDVTNIFIFFYHWYPSFLVLIGEFLTIVTFTLVLWFTGIFSSSGENSLNEVFTTQTQVKNQQIAKKALIFKTNRNDI